jgi:hypothetical protein
MTRTQKISISPLRFRAISSLILFAALGNIFFKGKLVMANDFFEVLYSAQFNRQMKCYKVTEKIREQSYTRLIEWTVIEETEPHRFLVITSSNRVYEESLSLNILSVQDIQTLEDAFRAVVSPDGSSIGRETWENFGSDTIDNSIDRIKALFGGRMFWEMQNERAPTDVQRKGKISARLWVKTTPIRGVSKEENPLRRNIKDLFRELRRKARAQQAYWKELDVTPAGRECHLLVIE